MFDKLRKNSGFTLVELLTSVAIIGVLVTISIPVFGDAVKSAREATCTENRGSLQSLLTSAYLMDSDVDAVFNEKKGAYTCPEGGSISYRQDPLSDDFSVRCSIHSPGLDSYTFNGILAVVVKNSVNQAGSAVNTCDSTAPLATSTNGLGGATEKVKAALTAAGYSLGDLGMTSWRYSGSQNMFYWTDVDISESNPGDKIPIIRYNIKSGNFAVFTATVKDSITYKGDFHYNTINDSAVENYKPSTSSSENGNQTLEKALEYYAELSEKMSGTSP